jgi:hypothetical protein
MKDWIKKMGGVIGAEEALEKAADEIDKASPGLSRKLLITIVAAGLGAITTWALTIDQRVYTMGVDMALRQTIAQEKVLLDQLEKRLSDETAELHDDLGELRQKVDALYCKVYDKECKFHGGTK